MLDWQLLHQGCPAYDLAYFLTGSFREVQIEEFGDRLLKAYYETLTTAPTTKVKEGEVSASNGRVGPWLLPTLTAATVAANSTRMRRSCGTCTSSSSRPPCAHLSSPPPPLWSAARCSL